MLISGMLFDLYGTLLIYGDMQQGWNKWFRALYFYLKRAGLTMPLAELHTLCADFFERADPPPSIDGLTLYERRFDVLAKELGLSLTKSDLQRIADTTIAAWGGYITPDPEAKPLLADLAVNLRLGLVSNYDHFPHVHRLMTDLQLAPYFRALVISGEVGSKKPEPAIFTQALRDLDLCPAETLHIGDSYEDVTGALEVGIRPILIHRTTDSPIPPRLQQIVIQEHVTVISQLSDLRGLL